ncbi:hypothetical protein MTO96_022385 [Rhipicephalus appendiculatus]
MRHEPRAQGRWYEQQDERGCKDGVGGGIVAATGRVLLLGQITGLEASAHVIEASLAKCGEREGERESRSAGCRCVPARRGHASIVGVPALQITRAAGWARRRRPCAADHPDRGPHAARSAGTPGRGSGADASPPTAASCGATSPAGRALLRGKGRGNRAKLWSTTQDRIHLYKRSFPQKQKGGDVAKSMPIFARVKESEDRDEGGGPAYATALPSTGGERGRRIDRREQRADESTSVRQRYVRGPRPPVGLDRSRDYGRRLLQGE